MKILATASAMMSLALPLQAHLGWTLEQCKATYGAPIEDREWQDGSGKIDCMHGYTFRVHGVNLEIQFFDNKAYEMEYTKPSKPYFALSQVEKLLSKCAAGQWKIDHTRDIHESQENFGRGPFNFFRHPDAPHSIYTYYLGKDPDSSTAESSVTVYDKIGVKSFKVEDRAGEEAVDNFLRSNAEANEKSETKDADQHN